MYNFIFICLQRFTGSGSCIQFIIFQLQCSGLSSINNIKKKYSGTSGCLSCHIPGNSIDPLTTNGTGSDSKHSGHLSRLADSCEICHYDYKSKPTHMNGTYGKAETDPIVIYNTENSGGTWTKVSKTCSRINCHGGGTGEIEWYRASTGLPGLSRS